jgi:protein-disulfide isomerase
MRFCSALVAFVLVAGCTAAPSPSSAQSAAPAPTTGTTTGEVLATVNGTPITEHDVRQAAGLELSRLEEQLYALKKQQIDLLVARRLMEAEAKRRGVTPEAFEEAEVTSRIGTVTDAEIDAFVEANRARIRGDVTQLRPQIRDFLREQKLEARREAVVGQLRSAATVDVRLAAPAPFRAAVDVDGAPVRGTTTAPITIVEYSDFHCPFCRRVQPTLTALLDKYKGQVRLVYKHLPLDGLHPQARRVSEAAWCAGQQDKFWEFHDAVYADSSSDASDATLARYAATAGLDTAKLTACLANPEAKAAVQRDVAQGEALGLNSTPGFFVNGREVRGAQPVEAFSAIIDEELRAARR